MTMICGLDIETTGLDKEKDQITEIAWVIRDTEDPKPFVQKSFFVKPEDMDGLEITEFNYSLTKITKRHLAFGDPLWLILSELLRDLDRFTVEALVAHNGRSFDMPFLYRWAGIVGQEHWVNALKGYLLIDTKEDIQYPEDCRGNNLLYLAAYYGFLNPFPHSALPDVQTMLKVLSHHDFETVRGRARSPSIVLQALVPFERRDEAKAKGYRWEKWDDEIFFGKAWIKKIKECDLQKETEHLSFQVMIREGVR